MLLTRGDARRRIAPLEGNLARWKYSPESAVEMGSLGPSDRRARSMPFFTIGAPRRRSKCGAMPQADYANSAFTGDTGSTPVTFASSPWNLYVSRLWSIPMQCKIVALSSLMLTGFSATL